MKDDCLFCQIAADPSKLEWENDEFAAFNDIHPKSKHHVLIVPKKHVDSLDHLDAEGDGGGLIAVIQTVAKQLGVAGGYKVQINVGRSGGQEVDHLHAHLLAD
jgi:histidine triad (HIT) family protein